MGEGDTFVNAVLGAVATVVLAFLPVSPVLGGALAGYLQNRGRSDGIRVGAISGALATVPLAFFGFVVVGLFFFGVEVGAVASVLFFAVFAGVFVYTVALSAIGGYAGVYFREEYLD
ncbi:DUF5518 domain-containing protein [Halospeciosus flavus]|uniref:DUF5518 domain-containing protein n=1 Tax=Halospeciosus flavus TaxID=3032283 RepID=A0ABD5Z8B9_9EURY|nr:DUF5518 domain-containing protein [Halospeciosus flavus]